MDTSKEYIEKCEKAFKDIGIIENNTRLTRVSLGTIPNLWGLKCEDNSYGMLVQVTPPESDGWFQIYYQDQLQEIYSRNLSFEKRNWNAVLHQLICYLQNAQEFFKDGSFTQEYRHCRSWEQLWLAFVMREKYQKVWDGKKKNWVKV